MVQIVVSRLFHSVKMLHLKKSICHICVIVSKICSASIFYICLTGYYYKTNFSQVYFIALFFNLKNDGTENL